MNRHGPWFKFWYEWKHDPKVQQLSEADQRRHVMALCLRCDGNAFDPDGFAWAMRITKDELLATYERFRTLGLVDADNEIGAWGSRQGKPDAERSKEYRERSKSSRDGHVIDTKSSRDNHASDSELDLDAELDTEKRGTLPPPPSAVPHVLGEGKGSTEDAPSSKAKPVAPQEKPKSKRAARGQDEAEIALLRSLRDEWDAMVEKHHLSWKWQGANGNVISYAQRDPEGETKLHKAVAYLSEHGVSQYHRDFAWSMMLICRKENTKGDRVDRPAEILEGGWSESQHPKAPANPKICTTICPECHQNEALHLWNCSRNPPPSNEPDPIWDRLAMPVVKK